MPERGTNQTAPSQAVKHLRPPAILLGAFCVQVQEPRQHFVAYRVRPAIPPGLLLVAPFFFFVVEKELAVSRNVAPSVGVENGPRSIAACSLRSYAISGLVLRGSRKRLYVFVMPSSFSIMSAARNS